MHPVAIIIPAFKPGEGLFKLVGTLATEHGYTIIVDDGSGPSYADLFSQCASLPGVTILRHDLNQGKGAALKTAFRHVMENPGEWVGAVTADADGQHSPGDILAVARLLRENSESLVLGVRNFGVGVPLRSRLGNVISRHVLRVVVGQNLEDTQTGLRGIPLRLLPHLVKTRANHYEFELEMLILSKHVGCPVLQHPIQTIYIDDNKSSHFHPFLDSLKIYYVLLRFGSISLLTSILDNVLFFCAIWAGCSLGIAQAIARCGAVLFNYNAARRTVFLSSRNHKDLLPAYVANVVVSGLLTYAAIRYLTSHWSIPLFWSKITAESALFFVNFWVQREIVFVKRDKSP